MDDLSLNRAVALARGWEVNDDGVWDGNVWLMDRPPDMDKPAVWGALLEELETTSEIVGINSRPRGADTRWVAFLLVGGVEHWAHASSPGRALGMAYLKSRGVTL